MRTLFFATTNRAKLTQLRWVVEQLGSDVQIVSAVEQFGRAAHYDESSNTEAEIARRGAQEVTARIGVPVLTEDTGLHVAALGGRPGVYAGRYLKAHGRTGLLREMQHCADRRAEIVSAVAWAAPDGDEGMIEHRVSGQIAVEEQWMPGLPDWIAPTPDNPLGGGYNAVFIPDPPPGQVADTRTLAEIPPLEALKWGYREPNFIVVLRRLCLAVSWTAG